MADASLQPSPSTVPRSVTKRVKGWKTRSRIRGCIRVCEPGCLSALVYVEGQRVVTRTQGTQILLVSVLPQKRASLCSVGEPKKQLVVKREGIGDCVVSCSGYLAPTVDLAGQAVMSAKRPKTLKLALLPEHSTNLIYASNWIDPPVF